MKDDLKSGLINLQGLEFIYEKNLFPDLEYIFRHALVQEVAYNSLLINRRKEIHEKIGRAIENLYPQRREEFYEMLAYHYSKSGNLAKAYEYLKVSAEKAVRNDATFEGVRFYKEAMEALTKLALTDDNKREQIDLVLAMQNPWLRIGFSEDYLPMLKRAEALAEEVGDDKKRVHIRSILGRYYITKGGDPDLGWKYLESCMEHPGIIQDVELMVPIGFDLCTSCIISGDYQRNNHIAPIIISLIERSRTQLEFFGKPFNPYSWVCALWGLSTGACGDFEQGERLLEKALKLALEIDHRGTIGLVEYLYGNLFALNGDGKSAAKHQANGLKHLVESQSVLYVGQAYCWLGYAHCLTGDPKTAVDLTEKGLKLHIDLGMPFWRSMVHWLCSCAHCELGDMEEAKTHAELAVKFSLENSEKVFQGVSKMSLGRVLAKTDAGQIEAAEQHIVQGISLLEELGVVAFSCWGYLWLGEVYAESGRREEALQNLKKAEAMSRDMGMDYWLCKAQDALARL